MAGVRARSVPLTAAHLEGLPGLRRKARAALLAAQPTTALEALSVADIGRKTTQHLVDLGLLTDPIGVQKHSLCAIERLLRHRH